MRAALRDRREAKGWTQAQLAKKVRVDQSTVSLWERGVRRPVGIRKRSLERLFAAPLDVLMAPSENAAGA